MERKGPKAGKVSTARAETNSPVAQAPWGAVDFEGFEVDQEISFNTWNPAPGEKRVFILLGWSKREGSNGTYHIYSGRDERSGEVFSFIGGGQFDWIVREKSIVTGALLGVVYRGVVKSRPTERNPSALGESKNWQVYILKAKA